jgi:glucose/arabinose dehydrogenase
MLVAGCQSQGAAQAESRSQRPFTVKEIAKFSTPWAMAFLPGSGVRLTNAALLTEREGRLWLVDVGSGKRTAVSGVPSVVVAGQGGLGDVMPHPDFAGNRRIYLSYVEGGPNATSGAALGYGTLDLSNPAAPALKDFKVIWRQQPKVTGTGHFSHRIAFGPDGLLYLSSGERQKFDPAAGHEHEPGQGTAADGRGRAGARQSMGGARRYRGAVLDDRPPQCVGPELRV